MSSSSLPVIKVSPETYTKFNACVHCGLCLPACPTYLETLDEADSPRGRIHLMKAAVDGRVEASDIVFEHLDRCLVCRACEPACPSGVQYHDLIEAVRPQVAEAVLGKGKRTRNGRLQWAIEHVLPFAGRVGVGMGLMKVATKVGLGGVVGRLMPGSGGVVDAVTRRRGGGASEEFPIFARKGERRGEVVLLRGCVGSVLSEGVNRACARVMAQNGFDVHVLTEELCCGALAAHANDPARARDFAMRLVETLSAKGGDYFISPIAGCGAQLKSLDKVVGEGGELAGKAREVVRRMRDVNEFLVEVGITPPPGRIERTVTYHDPCHLAHGQRITEAPRKLLGMVPGLKVVPLAEGDLCCGAAGTYNLNQPEMADRLGRRKAGNIVATGASEVVTANVGCTLQIVRHLKEAGHAMRVRHVVEVLAESYRDGELRLSAGRWGDSGIGR